MKNLLATLILLGCMVQPMQAFSVSAIGPTPLTFKELNSLTKGAPNNSALSSKINHLLATPFVYKNSSQENSKPKTVFSDPNSDTPFIRVASWNIERGFQLPHIIEVFNQKTPVNNSDQSSLKVAQEEADWLSKSQVIFLTEVDNGMNRTDYQNVAEKMASALHMNAVYGVEFLELGPLYIRKKQLAHKQSLPKASPKQAKADPELAAYNQASKIDPAKFRGLHGSAILTSYPILKTEIIRLPKVYDWYNQERKKLSSLEKVKRKAADTVFLEDVLTEIRMGSRMALAVDLEIPELPEHKATFVVVHLENRVKPVGRQIQMAYLLNKLKNRHNPVVIGGDFNTTGTDVSPTSVKKEMRQYATDPTFWARRAIGLFSPFGLFINLGLGASQFTKNVFDPSAPNIPLLLPNKERALFKGVKNFHFDDTTIFDVRGDHEHSYNHSSGLLADSNQRWLKGFVPTFSVERPLLNGLIGKYKLDWFFVKAYMKENPIQSKHVAHPLRKTDIAKQPMTVKPLSAEEQPYLFSPNYGRTLSAINSLYPEKMSDHNPITVDLPLIEPPKKVK